MSTRRLYDRAWARWAQWCSVMHASPLPAASEAVAAFLAELASAGKSVATVKGALAAIRFVHREAGHALGRNTRAIAAVMAGIARRSSRPIKRAAALKLDDMRSLVSAIGGEDVRSLRDRALLLVGFFGALRRSELVALDVAGNNVRAQLGRSPPRGAARPSHRNQGQYHNADRCHPAPRG
jgi:site-specific recombinase XerD